MRDGRVVVTMAGLREEKVERRSREYIERKHTEYEDTKSRGLGRRAGRRHGQSRIMGAAAKWGA